MAVIEENFSSFGVVLKTFRKRRHLTQQQLAEVIGVPSSIGSKEISFPEAKRWFWNWPAT
jgi:transcriptional regulator with XRE-family HTH domain